VTKPPDRTGKAAPESLGTGITSTRLPDDGRQLENLSPKVLYPSGQEQILAVGHRQTVFNTWSECWANITRCRPQGAYRPRIQFLTVRSFAPVQPATSFAREFRSFSSDFNASAIFIANA